MFVRAKPSSLRSVEVSNLCVFVFPTGCMSVPLSLKTSANLQPTDAQHFTQSTLCKKCTLNQAYIT